MNIFELAFVVLVIAVVVLGSRALGAALGVSAWIPGAGFTIALLLLLRAHFSRLDRLSRERGDV